MKDETIVTAAVIAAVNASGLATVWRNNSGSVRVKRGYMHLAPKGTPDIVGFSRSGRFVGIETKVAGSKTDKERAASQAHWQSLIASSGGISGQVTTVEEALELLRSERST